ncbi:hypothetical protein RAS1_04960 [Phycisphaerae bacterium RAS1]|nr:hypothetical protein RAS1_04960 [Phycisphaerae bacterium RAS1]
MTIPTRACLWLGVLLAASTPALAQPFEIDWSTIDSGGGMNSTGGSFEVSGTIGQPDAGSAMTGGSFSLVGGFWPIAQNVCSGFVLGDANCDNSVNVLDINGFVLGLSNPAQYAITFPGCLLQCVADINDDGNVNVLDINPFVALLAGG